MFLRYLAPADYRLRHDILGILREKAWRHKNAPAYDADLAIGSSSIAKDLRKPVEQVEDQLHVLVMRKQVAYYQGAPDPKSSHVLNEGAGAYTDKVHLKEGRDEAFKTLSVYGAWLGIIGAVIGITTSGIGYNNASDLEQRMDTLENRVLQRQHALSQTAPLLPDQSSPIRESVLAMCGPCPADTVKKLVLRAMVHQYGIDSAGNPSDTTYLKNP